MKINFLWWTIEIYRRRKHCYGRITIEAVRQRGTFNFPIIQGPHDE